MTFTHLPQLASFIRNTHCIFAGTPFKEDVLPVLSRMKADMDACKAITGITFEAMTDSSHGELNTLITISKIPTGGWSYEEVVKLTA